MIVSDQVEDGFRTIRVRDTTRPNGKQVEFFRLCDDPLAEEIMFDGSIRMGKSQAALRKMTQWAWKHGGRYAVARKTYPELINSTMKIALTGEGGMVPAIPEGLIADYIKSEKTVFLKNGAEILFTNLESVEEGKAKLRNISLNGMFIDQVEELDSDDWFQFYEELLGRLSDPRGPGKMLLAANPGPTDHWAYKRFVDPETSHKYPQCRYVHGTLYDNREYLDEKYFQGRIRTKEQNPEYYRRMVLGEWGSFGSKRFKVFDRAKHVVTPTSIPKWHEVIEGIDYGYSHPFVTLWVAIDEKERYHVFAEHYERERLISHHAQRIKDIREEFKVLPAATYADPQLFYAQAKNSSSSVALELNDNDIFPGKADNDRLGGWNRIEEMLSTYIEGVPQLTISAHCKHLIRELPNLRIKDNSDDVEKKNDDASDCLRYIVMSRPPVPKQPDDPEAEGDDRRTVYLRRQQDDAMTEYLDPYRDIDLMGV